MDESRFFSQDSGPRLNAEGAAATLPYVRRCLACEADFAGQDWRCPTCGYAPRVDDGGLVVFHETDGDIRGYDASLFERLAAVERESFWYTARSRLIVWTLARYFPDAATYFEVGCGAGAVLEAVSRSRPGLSIVGGDVAQRGLEMARRRLPSSTTLVQIDAGSLPFTAEFDVVGAFDVLEHVNDDVGALREIHRALRPRGGLLITVPHHPWLWSAADVAAAHVRRYRRGDLLRKLRATGFDVVRATAFVSFLLPAMAVSRALGRLTRRYDLEAELRAGGLLNRPFSVILDIERALIRSGISFPAGGSLLVVGRRR